MVNSIFQTVAAFREEGIQHLLPTMAADDPTLGIFIMLQSPESRRIDVFFSISRNLDAWKVKDPLETLQKI